MRSFVVAVVIIIVLAGGFGFVLNSLQEPASKAFSTEAARVGEQPEKPGFN